MVRATLADLKTVTRRIVKPEGAEQIVPFIGADNQRTGEYGWCPHPCLITEHIRCPYGQPGDRLWVRETWGVYHDQYVMDADEPTWWRATDEDATQAGPTRWRPSIHMPRWRSRITLEVTGVRVERLQDIDEEQARAEGVIQVGYAPGENPRTIRCGNCGQHRSQHVGQALVCFGGHGTCFNGATLRGDFAQLWESINGPGSWEANPWVWVVEFKRIEQERKAA
jgi:hypothetical protein